MVFGGGGGWQEPEYQGTWRGYETDMGGSMAGTGVCVPAMERKTQGPSSALINRKVR